MLTNENYFDKENQLKYFGSSQVKSFMECEAKTIAEIRGEFVREASDALLVGSYVDSHFEGTLGLFKAQHPEILKKDGTLKSQYTKADEIINRLEQDEMFMKYMGGEKQVIKTAELFGHPFKIKIDSYHEGKLIVDLKIMRDFEKVYKEGLGKVNFVDAWGYDIQAAIYQAVEGNGLPFVIAGATKEKVTDLDLFKIPQHKMDSALKLVEHVIDRFALIKSGDLEPVGCGKCDYCKSIKKIKRVRDLEELEADDE
ncbi:MAG: PD-(D/E)XK nuclease-like domain-containing protein [Anaerovoracaceae bacterium]